MSGITQSRSNYCTQRTLVAGAGATTNIAVSGILTTDVIECVMHRTASAADADLTSEASITSDGNIQLSSTVTTGDQLWVFWLDTSI